MNIIKVLNNFSLITILLILSSIVAGEMAIPFRKIIDYPKGSNQLEESIRTHDSFQMHHRFSLSTSIIDGTNYSAGIYSNFSNYKFSKNIDLEMGFHFIQSQNMRDFSSKFQPQIGYEVNLKYKLNPNSFLNIQISNFNNTMNSY